jgi:hypothetical protein
VNGLIVVCGRSHGSQRPRDFFRYISGSFRVFYGGLLCPIIDRLQYGGHGYRSSDTTPFQLRVYYSLVLLYLLRIFLDTHESYSPSFRLGHHIECNHVTETPNQAISAFTQCLQTDSKCFKQDSLCLQSQCTIVHFYDHGLVHQGCWKYFLKPVSVNRGIVETPPTTSRLQISAQILILSF